MIALLGTIPVFLAGLSIRRYAILYAVFISIFMSRAFSFTLSEGGAPITYTRMVYPLILVIALPAIISQLQNFRLNLFGIGLLHVIVVALATVLAVRIPALIYVVDWFLSSYLFLLAGMIFFKDGGGNKAISHFVTISVVALFVLAIFELLDGIPIIATVLDLSSADMSVINEKVLQGRTRNEVLRLQLFADNPLRLAQYANILYAFVVSNFASRNRVIKLVLVVMLFTIVYFSSSRSGILLFLIITLFAGFRVSPRLRQRGVSAVLYMFAVIAICFLAVSSFKLARNYQNTYNHVNLYDQTTEVRSSMERAAQLLWVSRAWLKSPVFGYGFLPNAGENLQDVSSLDSYALRTLLEGGTLGFLLFVAFVLRHARFALKNYKNNSAFGYLAISVGLIWGAMFEYTLETFMVSFFFLGYFEAKMRFEMQRPGFG